MAKLSAAEQYAKWLNQHPNATQKKLEKWLRGHGEVAYYLGQQAAATPTPVNADPTATGTGTATGTSGSGAADPTPATSTVLPVEPYVPPTVTPDGPLPNATRTPIQKAWDWLKNNPLVPASAADTTAAALNLGIWSAAAALVLWLIFRKKKL